MKKNDLSYSLVDSGNGRKLEQFGPYLISRPSAQAVWDPQQTESLWQEADAYFTRENENKWIKNKHLPEQWVCESSGVLFKISPTDFGHLGIFPEQHVFWDWMREKIKHRKKTHGEVRVLNLFAYSGGATLAAAQGGAQVCHLDASKGMVAWARENAGLNKLEHAPIRWITDDVKKFLARELKRGSRYEGIILDPPSFGRGSKGELFKIEDDIKPILQACKNLLAEYPLFLMFSCHTPGFTPIAMKHLLSQALGPLDGKIDTGEMLLGGKNSLALPSGTYARWTNEN